LRDMYALHELRGYSHAQASACLSRATKKCPTETR
jgi:hypothetical protein